MFCLFVNILAEDLLWCCVLFPLAVEIVHISKKKKKKGGGPGASQ